MNVFLPVKQLRAFLICFILMTISISTRAVDFPLLTKNLGEGYHLVHVNISQNYLLLPVEDVSPNVCISMVVSNKEAKNFDVRLAIHKVDYFVPIGLSGFSDKTVPFKFRMNSNDPIRVNPSSDNAACCEEMKLFNTFDTTSREKFRPTYHFSPLYGRMNDPNGMIYKDDEHHLFYQYNPYGFRQGNMSWGHAINKDLVNWEHHLVAMAPDALDTIPSGSVVTDHNNTAGSGIGAIIATYTQNSNRQVQSVAYSADNRHTLTEYENSPAFVFEARDLRDPKVLRCEATKRWIMMLVVGQEMWISSSPSLRDWVFESSFGEGYGAHDNVWEYPDLFELLVEGVNEKKWVLLCSLGDSPFGNSATQYFTSGFNSKKSGCDNQPNVTKWTDWEKNRYATVTWSDAFDNRRIAIAWMSNWQYANDAPTSQCRSPNSIPCDLSLLVIDGGIYLQSAPSPELLKLRGVSKKRSFKVNGTCIMKDLIPNNEGVYEMELSLKNQQTEIIGFRLHGDKGEGVDMQCDMKEKKFSMDRRRNGEVNFNGNFPMLTWTVTEEDKDEMKFRLFVDRSNVEVFGDGGRFAMTNQIFPSGPYNCINLHSRGGAYKIDSFVVCKLKK